MPDNRPLPRRILAAAILLAGGLAGCADTSAPATAVPLPSASASRSTEPAAPIGATMEFGRAAMTGFDRMSPNAYPHTKGGHAVDKVYPYTVVIERGQTVRFTSYPVHQLAIYAPGSRAEDIRLAPEFLADAQTPWGIFPDVLIDDPANRLAVSPISFETLTWTPDAATFAAPGRYLVICTLIFHFVETRMWGWVEVR